MKIEWIKDERVSALEDALREMLEAHSLKNVGLEASKRRIKAIKKARALLEQTETV